MISQKVQVWIVFNPTREALLFEVIPKRGGGWHPVTGSVEPHEVATQDFLDAAKRETLEETGIDPQAGQWIDLQYTFEFEGRWGRAQEHAFLFWIEGTKPTLQLDPSEHLGCKWVPLDEVEKQLSFDSQRRAFVLALQRVNAFHP
jgi:8-oxo-dGTP pyrophosphatase MutT (NUDIX family)